MKILIVSFGIDSANQTSNLLMSLGYRSLVCSPDQFAQVFEEINPAGVILAGGNCDIADQEIPDFKWAIGQRPLLAFGFGAQVITENLGGNISPAVRPLQDSYVIGIERSVITQALPQKISVREPKRGRINSIPVGFVVKARSSDNQMAIAEHWSYRVWLLDFHPEHQNTGSGWLILKNFCEYATGADSPLLAPCENCQAKVHSSFQPA